MREGVKVGERRDKILDVLKALGGRAQAREIAKVAIEQGDVFTDDELDHAAENWATERCRKDLKKPDEDGLPAAIQNEEYVVDENGETVSVHVWTQKEFWEPDQFMGSIRADARGVGKDILSIKRRIEHGRERWAGEDWDGLQMEFSFLA